MGESEWSQKEKQVLQSIVWCSSLERKALVLVEEKNAKERLSEHLFCFTISETLTRPSLVTGTFF